MGTRNSLVLKPGFSLFGKRITDEFGRGSMIGVVHFLRILLCNYVLYAFGLIIGYLFRFPAVGPNVRSHPEKQVDLKSSQASETAGGYVEGSEVCSLRNEIGDEKRQKTGDSVSLETSSTSKCEYLPARDTILGLIEDPKLYSFVVEEFFVGNDHSQHVSAVKLPLQTNSPEFSIAEQKTEDSVVDSLQKPEARVSVTGEDDGVDSENQSSVLEEENHEFKSEAEALEDIRFEAPVTGFDAEERQESEISAEKEVIVGHGEEDEAIPDAQEKSGRQQEPSVGSEAELKISSVQEQKVSSEGGEKVCSEQQRTVISEEKKNVISEKVEKVASQNSGRVLWVWEDYVIPSDSESDSVNSSVRSLRIDYQTDVNTSTISEDANFDEGLHGLDEGPMVPETSASSSIEAETVAARDQLYDSDDEFIELHPQMHSFTASESPILSREAEQEDYPGNNLPESCSGSVDYSLEKPRGSNYQRFMEEFDSDDDDDDFDFLQEHEDVVEQLRVELRNARTGGLPVIQEEEGESPELVQGLRPLKIDEKNDYKDHIDEIHKVYTMYSDKMKKLDILNIQTMHAIGFLQLKGTNKSTSGGRSMAPASKSLLSQNPWSRKARKPTADQNLKFTGDLQRNLEQVYVGQVCLSWEILRWQHSKLQELQEFDELRGFPHHYNMVADEFLLFQALLQRFIEDEKFKGPRIDNFIKNRCVVGTFLHVPAIKDDSFKDKNVRKGVMDDHAISSSKLMEIMKEAMRVFWEFIRSDKELEGTITLKSTKQNQIGPQDPADSQLLMTLRSELQKKERKLKDLLRSGNCIVKKLQRHQEIRLNSTLFIAQVELKLVSRVLSVSKLSRDQLLWCRGKLNQYSFVNRKVHVEPSFLFFPLPTGQ